MIEEDKDLSSTGDVKFKDDLESESNTDTEPGTGSETAQEGQDGGGGQDLDETINYVSPHDQVTTFHRKVFYISLRGDFKDQRSS